ncbi:hypothetical protein [Acetobacter pasteurianus]|nr:hypothetical protein [Acetobacter pasteurianus]
MPDFSKTLRVLLSASTVIGVCALSQTPVHAEDAALQRVVS